MTVQLVYATFPDEETARELGREALEQRVAACFTFWDAGSVYRWEGEVVEDEETLVLFKTSPEHREDLLAWLEDAHPYDVPCLLPLDSEDATQAYADWIGVETS